MLYTVLELKNVQLRYLEIKGSNPSEQLKDMKLEQILQLRFSVSDRHRSGTIHDWIAGDNCKDEKHEKTVGDQLRGYLENPSVQKKIAGKNFRAFTVVIVGSRQILMREMGREASGLENFSLHNEYWILQACTRDFGRWCHGSAVAPQILNIGCQEARYPISAFR
jgi:hypothetical protein